MRVISGRHPGRREGRGDRRRVPAGVLVIEVITSHQLFPGT